MPKRLGALMRDLGGRTSWVTAVNTGNSIHIRVAPSPTERKRAEELRAEAERLAACLIVDDVRELSAGLDLAAGDPDRGARP